MEKEEICTTCGNPIKNKLTGDKIFGLSGLAILLILLVIGAYYMYKNPVGAPQIKK